MKKDFFQDLGRLLKDLETSDHSMVGRSEEKRIGNKQTGPTLKTDYTLRARVGLPGKENRLNEKQKREE
ncbi:hypothetical protein [Alteribacter aurantiacus]|uniref:hypothetical protein n=1 Tax=Alteribacter aurantiacus TaxID=254410 RepID=UPI0003FFEFB1|nr:hypothetical protein [Alteribacter aurantiacus]